MNADVHPAEEGTAAVSGAAAVLPLGAPAVLAEPAGGSRVVRLVGPSLLRCRAGAGRSLAGVGAGVSGGHRCVAEGVL